MLTALHILVWLVAALMAVFVLLLVTPLRLQLSLQRDPALRSSVVAWPFGGSFFPVRVFDSRRKRARPDQPKAARKKTHRHRRPPRADVISTLPGVIHRTLATLHVEALTIRGEFGLGDPADTGRLYGQLTPLIYAFPGDITVRPNFETTCLSGQANTVIRVIPIAFLWPSAGFLWRMFGPFR